MIKKNRFNFVDPDAKAKHIKAIIGFFQDERDEEIGFVAAEEVLDFFLQNMGEEIYKNAANDCKKLVREKLEDLDAEMDMLRP